MNKSAHELNHITDEQMCSLNIPSSVIFTMRIIVICVSSCRCSAWLAWRSEWPSFRVREGKRQESQPEEGTAGGGEREKKSEIIQSWERLERAFEVKGRELDTQHAGRMERVREQRPFCSLSKSQRDREIYCERDTNQERRYTGSLADREEGACRVPTQKSYSSSETLQAFDHDPSRMLFGGRVKEMVHKESAEYSRPGERTCDNLGFAQGQHTRLHLVIS